MSASLDSLGMVFFPTLVKRYVSGIAAILHTKNVLPIVDTQSV